MRYYVTVINKTPEDVRAELRTWQWHRSPALSRVMEEYEMNTNHTGIWARDLNDAAYLLDWLIEVFGPESVAIQRT